MHDLKLIIVQMCGFSERYENGIQIGRFLHSVGIQLVGFVCPCVDILPAFVCLFIVSVFN